MGPFRAELVACRAIRERVHPPVLKALEANGVGVIPEVAKLSFLTFRSRDAEPMHQRRWASRNANRGGGLETQAR